LIVSGIVILVDQLSKIFVKGFSIPLLNINYEGMYYGQSFNIIGDFFKLTFVENPGMAFGIDVSDTSKFFLTLFTLLAAIGIFLYMYKIRYESFQLRLSFSFILGGALGNLIDRMFYGVFYGYAPLFYGKVVDFFDVDFFDFSMLGYSFTRWPIFNIADSAVTIGVILILFVREKQAEVPADIELNYETKIYDETEIVPAQTLNGPENEPDNNREVSENNDFGRNEEKKD